MTNPTVKRLRRLPMLAIVALLALMPFMIAATPVGNGPDEAAHAEAATAGEATTAEFRFQEEEGAEDGDAAGEDAEEPAEGEAAAEEEEEDNNEDVVIGLAVAFLVISAVVGVGFAAYGLSED